MNTLDPLIIAALIPIALAAIACLGAILTTLIAVRGTPGNRRAEIIDALADLIRAIRGR